MGYLDSNKPLSRVNGVRNVTGGTIPAQMWAEFMKIALSEISPTTFEAAGKINPKNAEEFRLPFKPKPSPSPEPSPEPSLEPSPEPSPSPAPSPTIRPSPLPSPSVPSPDD
jgi:membrane peptidoglycan carboxypeptidase